MTMDQTMKKLKVNNFHLRKINKTENPFSLKTTRKKLHDRQNLNRIVDNGSDDEKAQSKQLSA